MTTLAVKMRWSHFPILVFIVTVNIFSRLPFLYKELPPFQFCDESFFAADVHKMLNSKFPIAHEFRSGNLNSLPVYLAASILKFFGIDLNIESIVILGRVIMPMTLGALTCLVIYRISYLWLNSILMASLVTGLWVSSPYILSQSLIWYPDSYIAFFSSLVLLDLTLLLRNQESILRKKTIIKSVAIIAAGTSIKYNFLVFIFPYIAILYGQCLKREKKLNRFNKKEFDKKLKFAIVVCSSFIAVLNYSIFLNPLDFLRAMNSNRKIYQIDLERITGGITYLWNSLTLPWGVGGLFISFFGIYLLVRSNRFVLGIFLAPVLLYLFFGGLNQHIVVRNINIILPFMLVPILYLGQKSQFNRKRMFVYCSTLGLTIVLSSHVYQGNYTQLRMPDSTQTVLSQAAKFIPSDEVIGVNLGCSGPMPIELMGYSVVEDPQMSMDLKYYLFTSYYESILFDFYSQENISQSRNLKDAHFYFYNQDMRFSLRNKQRSLISYVPKNFEIVRVFRGNGPDFILLKKL
jgi:hypothetical protein